MKFNEMYLNVYIPNKNKNIIKNEKKKKITKFFRLIEKNIRVT